MLKHGILGLLSYGKRTGYEINEAFNASLNYFWAAQTSQIYRELQTLKQNGWVECELVEQKGRPDKKPYSITEEGHAELLRWLRDESTQRNTNSPLLLKTFFLGELPGQENVAFFESLAERSRASAAALESRYDAAREYSRQVPDESKAAYWRMTVEFGVMYNEMLEKWARRCADIVREEIK